MVGGSFAAFVLLAVLTSLLLVLPGTRGVAPSPSSGGSEVQYFRLDPGTPTETGGVFDVPVFVLAEPAGPIANRSETQAAWQDLEVVYVNAITVPFVNWSVLSWGAGRFDLQLSLTDAEVGAIEGGQALLALNSSVLFGSSVLGAAGIIDGAVLSSSTLVGAWWSTVFGIQAPPPDPSFSSLQGIVEDLAWFGASTAGRAAYAATTIVAVLLYLWEGHKLARAKLTGRKPGARREAA